MSTDTLEAPRNGEVNMTEMLDEDVPTDGKEPGDAFLAELDARRSPGWPNKRRRRKGNVMDRRASAAEAVVEDVLDVIAPASVAGYRWSCCHSGELRDEVIMAMLASQMAAIHNAALRSLELASNEPTPELRCLHLAHGGKLSATFMQLARTWDRIFERDKPWRVPHKPDFELI